MVIFLYGPDSFRRRERLDILRAAFKKKFDPKGLSISSLSGDEFTIDAFRSQTKSGGLFSTKRFVALTNLWALNVDQQAQILGELDTIGSDTILVISAENPPRKNNALFKRLLKSDTVEPYEELEGPKLRSFIQKKCKEFGATIEPQAAEFLIANVGADLWRLSNELKRLAAENKTITKVAVSRTVDVALDDNIFHLMDAIGVKNLQRASSLLQQQYELGANEQYLITMLGRQISQLFKVKKTKGQGLSLHPFVIEKSLSQSKNFQEQQLLDLYWQLLEIDLQLKSTSANGKALLDAFLMRACTR